jgi:hypothetical protein
VDLAAHLAVGDVLVEHDALEHARVLDIAARDLLHLGVPLDVDLLAPAVLNVHRLYSIEREAHHQLREAGDELGAGAALHELGQLRRVVEVERDGHLGERLRDRVQGLQVPGAQGRRILVGGRGAGARGICAGVG